MESVSFSRTLCGLNNKEDDDLRSREKLDHDGMVVRERV